MAKRNSSYDKNQPKYNWGNGWMKSGVTEKQASYLETLATKAGVTLKNTDQMKRGSASGLIDELKRMVDGDRHSASYLRRDWSKFVEVEVNDELH